jgi:hypothetical protein
MMSFVALVPQQAYAQAGQPVQFGNAALGQQAAQGITGVGTQTTDLLTVVRNAINFVLGLLSFIALCVLLWGGFNMVTAAGDDGKYNQGFTILRQAGIGLLFIGLSWIFVQFIFFILGAVTG